MADDLLSASEMAYEEGYKAWQDGLDPEDCPYDEDKQEHLWASWLDGWEDGSYDDEHEEDDMEEEDDVVDGIDFVEEDSDEEDD